MSVTETREHDAVEHPGHYTSGRFEVIEVIEDWKLGFHLGNVVKYLARAPHKGKLIEDLKKARWYLDRYIATAERQEATCSVCGCLMKADGMTYYCLSCGNAEARNQ